jgi:hypothetical protein
MLCSGGCGSSSSYSAFGYKYQSVISGLVSGAVSFASLFYVVVSVDLSESVEPFIGDIMSFKSVISDTMSVAFIIDGSASYLMVSVPLPRFWGVIIIWVLCAMDAKWIKTVGVS